MTSIRLIVGLGNPGNEYANTRHNVGYAFIDQLAEDFRVHLAAQSKFFGHLGQLQLANHSIKILKPSTFMNLSGQSVLALCQFHKIELNQVLVVHDELDLPPGLVRLKQGGGHGGHNGLRNIIERFGGEKNFYRLRLGIGHPGHKSKVHGHVLSKPPADDQISIAACIEASIKILPKLLENNFQSAMQQLHSQDFSTSAK